MCRTPYECDAENAISYELARRPFSAPTLMALQTEWMPSYDFEHWLAHLRSRFEVIHLGNVGLVRVVQGQGLQRL